MMPKTTNGRTKFMQLKCPLWVKSRRLHCTPPMSASPPKADMCGALAHVCYGPKADIGRPKKERPPRGGLAYTLMGRSIASGHWQTEALFFEFFPYPFKLLVV